MRCVYVAENLIDAQLVRDRLCDEGIPAEIHGADLTGSFGLLPGFVSVWVSETKAMSANRILDLLRAQSTVRHEDDAPCQPDGEVLV